MFDILFGWRKASRCKKLIKRVQCRLKLLKSKRDSIIRQLHDDISQLLKKGQEKSALARVEQLTKDQSIKVAYDLLDQFCEFIIINLPYIRRHRDCPNDIGEAVSSLSFASARCGDLPELNKLRKLFGERYGHKFATGAVELLPGNLVNHQIIEKLCVKSVSDDVKLGLMKEIARNNNLQLGPTDTKVYDISFENFDVEWEEKVSDRDIQFTYNGVGGSQLQISNDNEMQGSAISYCSSSDTKKLVDSLDITTKSVEPLNSNQIHKSLIETEKDAHKMERTIGEASESSYQFSERTIIYLDDIEEFQPIMKEDVSDKDQRLFMFKSTVPPPTSSCAVSFIEDHTEPCKSSDGKTSSKRANKRRKQAKKRLKRRCVFVEDQMNSSSTLLTLSMNDVECALYYGESRDSSPDGEGSPSSSFTSHRNKFTVPKRSYYGCLEMGKNSMSHKCKYNQRRMYGSCIFNQDVGVNCCLEHPCYFLMSDDKDDQESPSPTRSNRTPTLVKFSYHDFQRRCHCQCSSCDEALSTTLTTNKHCKWTANKAKGVNMRDQEMGRPQKPKREDYEVSVVHAFMPSQSHRKSEQSKVKEREVIDFQAICASSHGSCSRMSSPWTQTRARPPYLRAVTMPLVRPRVEPTDQILRSTSFQFQSSPSSSCSHVHPNLPNYDDLAARFSALKKEYMQSSTSDSGKL